jgi:predicted alpha/beta superfamily hydrolase
LNEQFDYLLARSLALRLRGTGSRRDEIIVGLDYAGENLDYFRMRDDDLLPMTPLPSAGRLEHTGAEAFLSLIESQAIPLLERDYRAGPHYRVVMGVSDAGAFALYAFFKDPDLFQAYVAASPSTINVWPYEAMFAQSARHTNSRLFMSVGGDESPRYRRGVRLLADQISSGHYIIGGFMFRELDGMRHSGESSEALARGLQFAFAPIAPESGPVTNQSRDKVRLVGESRPGELCTNHGSWAASLRSYSVARSTPRNEQIC